MTCWTNKVWVNTRNSIFIIPYIVVVTFRSHKSKTTLRSRMSRHLFARGRSVCRSLLHHGLRWTQVPQEDYLWFLSSTVWALDTSASRCADEKMIPTIVLNAWVAWIKLKIVVIARPKGKLKNTSGWATWEEKKTRRQQPRTRTVTCFISLGRSISKKRSTCWP